MMSQIDEYRSSIQLWLNQELNFTQIAQKLAERGVRTTRHSIRRAVQRWAVENDELEVELEDLGEVERLLEERGLDPEDWEVSTIRVNEWGKEGENRQLRATFSRKNQGLQPARVRGAYQRKVPQRPDQSERLVILLGDQHAPFFEPRLHDLVCQFIADQKPDQGVLLGDLVDFPNVSRHPANPEWSASTQLCLDEGYGLMLDYVLANEAAHWTFMCGNHEERLRRSIINQVPDIYGLCRADAEEPVLGLPYLLRLDELGIEFVEPYGSYEHAQLNLSPKLAVRHGWLSQPKSGATATKTLEKLGYSVAVAHCHRQGKVYKTQFDIDGNPSTLVGVEIGCLCQIDLGLGYHNQPDWNPGFCTVAMGPDGFNIELGTYVDKKLFWRDRIYQ